MEQCDYIFDRSRRFEPGRLQLIPTDVLFALAITIVPEPTPLLDTPHPRLLTGKTPKRRQGQMKRG